MDVPDRYPELANVVRLLGEGEITAGLDALGPLITSSDPDLRPRAILLLGRINEARGDTEHMLRAYRVAAESGHPEVAPFARAELGLKLIDLGRIREARRELRRAAATGDPAVREIVDAARTLLPKRRGRRPDNTNP
jgi:hypothetical protein